MTSPVVVETGTSARVLRSKPVVAVLAVVVVGTERV